MAWDNRPACYKYDIFLDYTLIKQSKHLKYSNRAFIKAANMSKILNMGLKDYSYHPYMGDLGNLCIVNML